MIWRPALAVCFVAALSLTACQTSPPTAAQPTAGQPTAGQPTAGQAAVGQPSAGQPAPGGPGATTATAATAPPNAGPTAGAGTPACKTADLKVTVGPVGHAAGRTTAPVRFRNTGQACRIGGYPTVVAYAAGRRAGTAKKTPRGFGGGRAPGFDAVVPYLLAKGATATAVVEAQSVNTDGTPCPAAVTRLRITPPGQAQAAQVAWSGGCTGFEVHPVIHGVSGIEG